MAATQNRSSPVSEWPEADRRAWELATEPPDLLDPQTGFALRWAPATRKMIENCYGHWLGWLEATGRLEPQVTPEARATLERVRGYRDAMKLRGLADYTLASRIKHLGDALRAIAPHKDWGWIARAASRLHSAAVPARDLRSRLRPADEVFRLGADMMHAAEHDRFRTPVERATLFRDGVLIAFLVLRPLRLKNLASLTIGRHVQLVGASCSLVVPPEEEKARRGLECEWPAELTGSLQRYVEVHRPVLLQCRRTKESAGRALWISKQGTAMTNQAIAYQIKSRTAEEFGEAINPHSFRHIAATTIATIDPDNAADIAAVLGHSGLGSSDKHYNRGRVIDAGRRLQNTIAVERNKNGRKALLATAHPGEAPASIRGEVPAALLHHRQHTPSERVERLTVFGSDAVRQRDDRDL